VSSPAAPGRTRSAAQQAEGAQHTRPVGVNEVDTLQSRAGNRAVSQLLGGGTPLSDSVRADMEARFGTSFSDVRIHTGPNAQTASSALGAAAFTHGPDVVFGQGSFAPESGAGKRLLAHELAHVVQQRRGGLAPVPGNASPTEIGAERAANDVAAGAGPVQVQGASAIGIAKSEEADGATDDSAIAPLRERFRQTMVQLLVDASALGGPGPALLGKVIEGMSDQLYEELWVNGRGAKLFWNILSLGPGELAKAGVTYQLGVIEGAVSPVTDLFGMAVFAENVRNALASLTVSTYNASDQIGPEIRALIASTGELTQAARDSVSAIVNDPDALNTLFSLPQATYALATRNAYDLGKAGGLKVMAALESPWSEDKEASEAPELGVSTVFSWIGSKVNALREWGVVSPGAKIGEAVGFAMGMVAIQLLALLATGGMSGALKGAGTAMAKVGTAVARISPRAGGAISQVGGLVTVLGSAANEINLAINALDDVAMAALKRFVGPLLDKLRVVLGSLQDLLGKIRDAEKREALPAPRMSSEELARRIRGSNVDPDEVPTQIFGPGERPTGTARAGESTAKQRPTDEAHSGLPEDSPSSDAAPETEAADENVPLPGKNWKQFNSEGGQGPQGFTKDPDPSPDDIVTEVPGARNAATPREPDGAKQFRPATDGEGAAERSFQKFPDAEAIDVRMQAREVIGVAEGPELPPRTATVQPGALIEAPIAGTDQVEMVTTNPMQHVYTTERLPPDPVPEVLTNEGPVSLEHATSHRPELLEDEPLAVDPPAAHQWKRFVDAPPGGTQTSGFQKYPDEMPDVARESAGQNPTLVPDPEDVRIDEEAEAWAAGWGDLSPITPVSDTDRARRRRRRD